MSAKVVHISEDAHTRAKVFCQVHSLRMSDWVALLIEEAIASERTDPKARSTVPKKKPLEKTEAKPTPQNQGPNIWEQPPFWSSLKK